MVKKLLQTSEETQTDVSAEDHLLDELVPVVKAPAAAGSASKKRIRPTKIDVDDEYFGAEAEQDEVRKPSAKRRRKAVAERPGKKAGASTHLPEAIVECILDALSQRTEEELLGGGCVEWSFPQEVKVAIYFPKTAKQTKS